MTKIEPGEVNVTFLYFLETSESHRFLMFPGEIKGNIDPKRVKQLQYRKERHNLTLLTGNANSSIIKQNVCKNKATWLTKRALSKSFSLFHTIYTEDIKAFFKGLFFCSKLVLYKRFSNEIAFKFSKNVELKIVNSPKIE